MTIPVCLLLIVRRVPVSSPNLNLTAPIDLEQLLTSLLPKIKDAVRWSYLRYQHRIRRDELDDLSQQIILSLIEDNCRRLRLFNGQSSFESCVTLGVGTNTIYKRKQLLLLKLRRLVRNLPGH
jgi:hypothetical protein